MLSFLRSDLAQLVAYTPHPGGASGNSAEAEHQTKLDRLDTNENPYDLPEELKQKLAWAYQHELESNRYPDGGQAALKQSIAEYVNESAGFTEASPEHISVGNGSDELIRSILIATCLGGEGSILVANPTFSMYRILAQTLGIPVVSVGRSDSTFEMNLAEAKAAMAQAQPAIRVVFVVHPNSPTANPLTQAEIEWLRSLPENVLVVIDEAYFEFSQSTLVSEALQRLNWVILRTFSKALRLAGHRIGYAIARPELIAALEKVRLPYNLPSTTQTAALLALAHRQALLEVIPLLLAERDRLSQRLTAHPLLQVFPSVSNFLFVRLKPGVAEAWQVSPEAALERLFHSLRAEGTLIRQINGGLRITVGTPEENQRTGDRLFGLLPSS